MLSFIWVGAQVKETKLDSVAEKMIIIEGDSIFQQSIALDEVYIFGKLKFESYEDKLQYYIYWRERRSKFILMPSSRLKG